MNLTILGCGASAGVPLIGCECAICQSENPKNSRTRSSLLIENNGFKLLVDVSPDLRQQALARDLKSVDAIFITHAHADHCHGIDDVRSFNFHRDARIPLYADALTLEELKTRFGYVFQPPSSYGWIRASLSANEIALGQAITTGNIDWTPFAQHHGGSQLTYGLRVGKVAYSTDVVAFPPESEAYLYDLDVWIVDCLRFSEAPTHAHFDLTMQWIERYRPKRTILTHMSHDFEYEALRSALPSHIEPAYDGMVIQV